MDIINVWATGFQAKLQFTVDHDTEFYWTVHLSFDAKIDQFSCYQGTVSTSDGLSFVIDNFNWDGDISNGESFTIEMMGVFSGKRRPKLISATIDQQDICSS